MRTVIDWEMEISKGYWAIVIVTTSCGRSSALKSSNERIDEKERIQVR
jgi:hypothetical protein